MALELQCPTQFLPAFQCCCTCNSVGQHVLSAPHAGTPVITLHLDTSCMRLKADSGSLVVCSLWAQAKHALNAIRPCNSVA